jgi:hypothetical protein
MGKAHQNYRRGAPSLGNLSCSKSYFSHPSLAVAVAVAVAVVAALPSPSILCSATSKSAAVLSPSFIPAPFLALALSQRRCRLMDQVNNSRTWSKACAILPHTSLFSQVWLLFLWVLSPQWSLPQAVWVRSGVCLMPSPLWSQQWTGRYGVWNVIWYICSWSGTILAAYYSKSAI